MRQQHVAGSDLAPRLTAWGVSSDADLIYRYLLVSGARTTADIESRLGMSRKRVAAGLDELRSLGAARPWAERQDVTWVPSPIANVVLSLRQRSRGRARATRPPDPLSAGRLPAGSVPLGDGLRHLPSRALARARMAELVGLVRHEHMAMSPERAFDAESARAAVPMDRERDLVMLFMQGHTDESAARELRVSRRTVSTVVSDLMEKVGVCNRFQLGVVLGASQAVRLSGQASSSARGGGKP